MKRINWIIIALFLIAGLVIVNISNHLTTAQNSREQSPYFICDFELKEKGTVVDIDYNSCQFYKPQAGDMLITYRDPRVSSNLEGSIIYGRTCKKRGLPCLAHSAIVIPDFQNGEGLKALHLYKNLTLSKFLGGIILDPLSSYIGEQFISGIGIRGGVFIRQSKTPLTNRQLGKLRKCIAVQQKEGVRFARLAQYIKMGINPETDREIAEQMKKEKRIICSGFVYNCLEGIGLLDKSDRPLIFPSDLYLQPGQYNSTRVLVLNPNFRFDNRR